MNRAFVLTLLCLVITGCAATPSWTKPGASKEELDAAVVDCNNQLAVEGPASKRMSGIGATGTLGSAPVKRAGTLEHQKNFDQCMKAKGWTREE